VGIWVAVLTAGVFAFTLPWPRVEAAGILARAENAIPLPSGAE
jgi:hypothetical protein